METKFWIVNTAGDRIGPNHSTLAGAVDWSRHLGRPDYCYLVQDVAHTVPLTDIKAAFDSGEAPEGLAPFLATA